MANIKLLYGTDALYFKPGNFHIEERLKPLQVELITPSGKMRVVTLGTNEELILESTVALSNTSVPEYGQSSYLQLKTFIDTNLNFKANTCALYDADGTEFTVRYLDGFDTLNYEGHKYKVGVIRWRREI